MNENDYLAEDAVGLASKIATGDVSAAEVMDAALARIAKVNLKINALVHEDFDRARATATNPPSGALGGVPFVIKDLDPVEGMPMYSGSRAVPGQVATEDGVVAAQLKATGLIPIGKSQTPEFGLTATTE
ncbi:MAG: amidase family protein, partial [Alphaproteobacteria bacterium]